MRDEEIKLAVCEGQRRATVLHEKPFRMDAEQFANRVVGALNGRRIFGLKQHLRESTGVMLTSRCSTNFSLSLMAEWNQRRNRIDKLKFVGHSSREINSGTGFQKVKILINEIRLSGRRGAHSDWTLWRIASKLDGRGFGNRSRQRNSAARERTAGPG